MRGYFFVGEFVLMTPMIPKRTFNFALQAIKKQA